MDKLIELRHHDKSRDITSADYLECGLVAIEMFLLSVVATYTFSYEDFKKGFSKNSSKVFLKIPKIFFGQVKDTIKDITRSQIFSENEGGNNHVERKNSETSLACEPESEEDFEKQGATVDNGSLSGLNGDEYTKMKNGSEN